jgi:predicted SAM-dependent methyltransferase
MRERVEDLLLRHETLRGLVPTLLVYTVNFPLVRLGCAARLKRLVSEAAPDQAWLHLGCGRRPFRGWINIDIIPYSPGPDVLWDLRRPLALSDNSIDLIYSEDLIEHLEFAESRQLLRESYRVLRPGGIMRLMTPNLRSFTEDYVKRSPELFAYYRAQYGTASFAEMLNHAMRSWGHRFIYDDELLTRELSTIGFSLETQTFNQSNSRALRGLDRVDEKESEYRIYLDCRKPLDDSHLAP